MRALPLVAFFVLVGCATSAPPPEAAPPGPSFLSISEIETVVSADSGRFVREDRNRAPGQLLLGRTGLVLTGVVAQTTRDVNSVVALPVDIPVYSEPCGEENAYYNYVDDYIVICDDLVAAFDRWLVDIEDPEQRNDLLWGGLEFITLHEMGHALVDQFELPVLGRNEDAADLLAAYFAVRSGDTDRVTGGLVYFLSTMQDRIAEAGPEFIAYWGQHGLSEQRMAATACYLYGSNPQRYGYLVGTAALPLDPASEYGAQRLYACQREYSLAVRDIERVLAPHARAE